MVVMNPCDYQTVEGRLAAISFLTAETRTFIGRGHLHFLCTPIPHGSNTENTPLGLSQCAIFTTSLFLYENVKRKLLGGATGSHHGFSAKC